MRRLVYFCLLAVVLWGCQCASQGYQPGIKGVRDNPVSDPYSSLDSQPRGAAAYQDQPTSFF